MPRRVRLLIGWMFVAAMVAIGAQSPRAEAQVRIVNWNISNFGGGLVNELRTAVYAEFNGQSMSPDAIIVEEVVGNGANTLASLVSTLNGAVSSPGDWAAVPFVASTNDTSNGLVYRTSKLQWIATLSLTTGTGSGPINPPRDNQRWRMRLVGYTSSAAEIYIYASHMKAGSSPSDQDRRTPEATRIRNDTAMLPAGAHYLLGGDFNIQSSSQTAYQLLVAGGDGQLLDPINTPGGWNNSSAFRFVHTQDPAGAGGMDDRHDQILVSPTLRDGSGLAYLPSVSGGNILAPYSTVTWNDMNHSYRAWGNDGTSLNTTLRTSGNTMVGPTIAQALIDSTSGGGHLPVFLDIQVPARLVAPALIDFGDVALGSVAEVMIAVSNGIDPSVWSRTGVDTFGLERLNYTLSASMGFTAPAGALFDDAGGGVNMHVIGVDTSSTGPKAGLLTITSNSADGGMVLVPISANVIVVGPPVPPPGNYDVNGDGLIDIEDLYSWYVLLTDVDGNGTVNTADLTALRFALRFYERADVAPGR